MTSVSSAATGRATGEVATDVATFRELGFLIVPGLMSGDELAALQAECGAQIELGPSDRGPDVHFRQGVSADGRDVLFRIEAVVAKRLCNDSALLAMAHPRLLTVASGILEGDFICWSDALLWKGAEGGAAVAMHSGHGWNDTAVAYENLVVDIYLDHATPENGCLRVLPGSNRLSPEENRALVPLGERIPGLVDVTMHPGDVLFHSEWMIHGSPATPALGRPSRRILYFAFRNPSVYLAPPRGQDSPTQRHLIASCMRRMQLAHERRQHAPYASGESPFPLEVLKGWDEQVAAISDADAHRVGYFGDIFAS